MTWDWRIATPTMSYGPGSTTRYLWPGGVLSKEPINVEVAFRLADGTRKSYSSTGGWVPWAFIWSFQKMPTDYMQDLWFLYRINKGTPLVAPMHLELIARMQDYPTPWPNPDPDNFDLWFEVDIASFSSTRAMAPRGGFAGYSGSVRFEQALNPSRSGGSLMWGGVPETEDVL